MKSSEKKLFIAILAVAVVLVALAVYPMLTAPPGPTAPKPSPKENRQTIAPPGTHLRGDPKAPYTIVVFSDFECPTCRESVAPMAEIINGSHGKINEGFRHFQAMPTHRYSRLFARAAEAAGEQGEDKFWKMHDVLFDRQPVLKKVNDAKIVLAEMRREAQNMKLDMIAYDAAMSKQDDKKFLADNDYALRLGMNSTPTFFFLPPQGQGEIKAFLTIAELKDWLRQHAP